MPQNNGWDQLVGDPMQRMISVTCHEREGESRAGKRVFITLGDCLLEEHDDYTVVVPRHHNGRYYYVRETPEQIFAKAGMPTPGQAPDANFSSPRA